MNFYLIFQEASQIRINPWLFFNFHLRKKRWPKNQYSLFFLGLKGKVKNFKKITKTFVKRSLFKMSKIKEKTFSFIRLFFRRKILRIFYKRKIKSKPKRRFVRIIKKLKSFSKVASCKHRAKRRRNKKLFLKTKKLNKKINKHKKRLFNNILNKKTVIKMHLLKRIEFYRFFNFSKKQRKLHLRRKNRYKNRIKIPRLNAMLLKNNYFLRRRRYKMQLNFLNKYIYKQNYKIRLFLRGLHKSKPRKNRRKIHGVNKFRNLLTPQKQLFARFIRAELS